MLPVSSAAYFGHPPPPQTHILEMPTPSENVHLGAAATKRCVSAQLWGKDNVSKAEPMEILCLSAPEAGDTENDDEQEEITCASIVALDPTITGSDSGVTCASIVVGTSFNRVLSMEVHVEKDENGTFSLHIGRPPFEPMPLDSLGDENNGDDASDVASMTSDASSRHGCAIRGRSESLRDSQHASNHRTASLSTSRHNHTPNRNDSEHDGKPVRFCPSGGVTSITPYRVSLNDEEGLTPVIWIAYGDGTTVRLHQGAFFSSVVHNAKFFEMLGNVALRSRVRLPPSVEGITVLPLPKYHPSPLAALPPWKQPRHEKDAIADSPDGTALTSDDGDEDEDEDEPDVVPEFHEALAYGGDPNSGVGEQFPALAFYTSENQFVGRITDEDLRGRNASSNDDAALLDHVIGGTTALVSGVFGSALGVVKWGLGHGDNKVCLLLFCALVIAASLLSTNGMKRPQ